MRYSKQREVILKVVLDSCDHPCVDVIYNRVKKIIPNISLGTVYRNLTTLHENGDIRKVQSSTGKDHYDKTLKEHAHLYCKSCNSVLDVELTKNFDNDIQRINNCKISTSNIIFTGTCSNCIEGELK